MSGKVLESPYYKWKGVKEVNKKVSKNSNNFRNTAYTNNIGTTAKRTPNNLFKKFQNHPRSLGTLEKKEPRM